MSDIFSHTNNMSSVTSGGAEGGLEIFRSILHACCPEGFSDFQSGVIDKEEGYKARNHKIAHDRLGLADWETITPDSGLIVARVIDAIEIKEDTARGISQNNVLMWWPPNVAHRGILDIREEGGVRLVSLESHLRDLYLDLRPEAELFAALSNKEMLGRSFPLLGYQHTNWPLLQGGRADAVAIRVDQIGSRWGNDMAIGAGDACAHQSQSREGQGEFAGEEHVTLF